MRRYQPIEVAPTQTQSQKESLVAVRVSPWPVISTVLIDKDHIVRRVLDLDYPNSDVAIESHARWATCLSCFGFRHTLDYLDACIKELEEKIQKIDKDKSKRKLINKNPPTACRFLLESKIEEESSASQWIIATGNFWVIEINSPTGCRPTHLSTSMENAKIISDQLSHSYFCGTLKESESVIYCNSKQSIM